ncbi:hypothetical protein C2869_11495 [Saccharobesus litoralis]|uniref:Thioredoxin domain-containing protein n=1 Tax=Saccharobesus litoralis TaxID=2172099 RepID=A0A2S0VS42_9ALTE|nr:TlpA disulfide reductase family protein [Saccharobesus litoralis]AWB67024.1 hypothetical protein C2869_11495 [Saccharobesus litoralis]
MNKKKITLYYVIALALAFIGGIYLANLLIANKHNNSSLWHLTYDTNIVETQLGQINSDYLVLDFWSSWCKPCAKSLPYYLSLFDQYPKEKIRFITINLDIDNSQALKFLDDNNLNALPIFFDPNNKTNQFINISGLPMLIIYDQNRQVIHQKMGFKEASKHELKQRLDKLLKS